MNLCGKLLMIFLTTKHMKEETFNLFGSNWTVKFTDEIAIDKEEGF